MWTNGCANLPRGGLILQQESPKKNGGRLYVALLAARPRWVSQFLNGRDNRTKQPEKRGPYHRKLSCREFPTCSDVSRFDGSISDLSPPQLLMREVQRNPK